MSGNTKAAAAASGWDYLLLTFIHPSFDGGSGVSWRSGRIRQYPSFFFVAFCAFVFHVPFCPLENNGHYFH